MSIQAEPDGLPFSQACENNRQVILDLLWPQLSDTGSLLEIGGGTGQHAVAFARAMPHLRWHSTDQPKYVDTLNLRIQHAQLPNLPQACGLDVTSDHWDVAHDVAHDLAGVEAVFTANTLHIMSADAVADFFAGLNRHLPALKQLFIYGPFRYNDEFTTASNASFDQWLKERDSRSGIRDIEMIMQLAESIGLRLVQDHSMPANNQLLVLERSG